MPREEEVGKGLAIIMTNPLHVAIINQDLADAASQIALGADLNIPGIAHTLLRIRAAAIVSPTRHERATLRSGIETALHYAIFFEDLKMTQLLLDAGADANYPTADTCSTALHLALRISAHSELQLQFVRAILATNPQIDAQDSLGGTALLNHSAWLSAPANQIWLAAVAECSGPEAVLRLLLDSTADPDLLNSKGDCALTLLSSNPQFLEPLLLVSAALVDRRDRYGNTALVSCVNLNPRSNIQSEEQRQQAIRTLLHHKASVDLPDGDGRTALFHAAISSATGSTRLLLDSNASLLHEDNEGINVLQMLQGLSTSPGADEQWRELCIVELQKARALALQLNPLHVAVINGDLSQVSRQLAHAEGVDVDATGIDRALDKSQHTLATDNGIQTALHYAILFKAREMVALLLQSHADVDYKTSETRCGALHLAMQVAVSAAEKIQLVKLIVAAGASLDLVDIYGRTPLFVFCDQMSQIHIDVVRQCIILEGQQLEDMGEYEAAEENQRHKAMEHRESHQSMQEAIACHGIMSLLLERNADPQYKVNACLLRNGEGDSVLSHLGTNPAFLRMLLTSSTALIDTADSRGNSPIMNCVKPLKEGPWPHREVRADAVRTLLQHKATATVMDNDGKTALYYAILDCDSETTRLLFDCSASLDVVYNAHGQNVNIIQMLQAHQDCLSKAPADQRSPQRSVKSHNEWKAMCETLIHEARAKSLQSLHPLHRAVAMNDTTAAAIQAALPEVDVDTAGIALAIEYGSDNAAQLNNMVQLNCDHGVVTPLHYAVAHQRPEMVNILLDARADPNQRTAVSSSAALHLAMQIFTYNEDCWRISDEVVERLRYYSERVGTFEELTGLDHTIWMSTQELIQGIVESIFKHARAKQMPVDVNAQDADGNTPLMLYLQKEWMSLKEIKAVDGGATLQLLLDNRADPSIQNHAGNIALSLAVVRWCKFSARCDGSQGHPEARKGVEQQERVLRQLLAAKAFANECSSASGETPLHVAARYNQTRCVRLLISSNASLAIKTHQGNSVLDMLQQAGTPASMTLQLRDWQQERADTNWMELCRVETESARAQAEHELLAMFGESTTHNTNKKSKKPRRKKSSASNSKAAPDASIRVAKEDTVQGAAPEEGQSKGNAAKECHTKRNEAAAAAEATPPDAAAAIEALETAISSGDTHRIGSMLEQHLEHCPADLIARARSILKADKSRAKKLKLKTVKIEQSIQTLRSALDSAGDVAALSAAIEVGERLCLSGAAAASELGSLVHMAKEKLQAESGERSPQQQLEALERTAAQKQAAIDAVEGEFVAMAMNQGEQATAVVHNSVESCELEDVDKLCVVCMCEPKDVVLIPCGHVCVCVGCAELVVATTEPLCPVCRGPIASKHKIYM